MDFIIPSSKNSAQVQMASGLSASGDTIQLKAGEASILPAGAKGSATSVGDSENLNSTGIGSKAVAGQFIRNITDGSVAWILSVSADSVTTTKLINGTDNTWDSSDEYVVGTMYMWLSKKGADGVDTTRELVKIEYIDSASDQVHIETRGVEGTPTAFAADDYCSVYISAQYMEEISNAIGEMQRRKADSEDVILRDGSQAATGDIPMGGNKITGLADGISGTDAVTKNQLDASGSLSKTMELGEDIATNKAARIADGTVTLSENSFTSFYPGTNSQGAPAYTNRSFGQTFFVGGSDITVEKIRFRLKKEGAGATANVGIKAVDGSSLPTGSFLVSTLYDGSVLTTSYQTIEIVFPSAVTLSANTEYAITFEGTSGDSSNNIRPEYQTGGYANGHGVEYTGTVWQDYVGRDFGFEVFDTVKEGAGKLYKTDASSSEKIEFHGFTKTGGTLGQNVILQALSFVSGFSGLNAGKKQYLSDTPGEISETPGTNTKLIGVAADTQTILISNE